MSLAFNLPGRRSIQGMLRFCAGMMQTNALRKGIDISASDFVRRLVPLEYVMLY